MNKVRFCKCLKVLKNFSEWEDKMYDCGFQLMETPVDYLATELHSLMCEDDLDWSFDKKLGIDWIVEWCAPESDQFYQKRHGREWNLEAAGDLYEFLVFMNEHGWED